MHTPEHLEGRQAAVCREGICRRLADVPALHRWYSEARARAGAFTNPSTNSYKRLTPGFEAPVLLAYSSRNRSAGIRIPMYPEPEGEADRSAFPDPAANPYLAFAAMLMAGLDGIENKINPGEPAEKDLYDLEAKEAAKIRTMPGSLDEALNHLEKDHQFLLKGGVFSEDLIEAWIGYKRTKEVDTMRLRPHPYEFSCITT